MDSECATLCPRADAVLSITLPTEAQAFLKAFDNDRPVAPLAFELPIPSGWR